MSTSRSRRARVDRRSQIVPNPRSTLPTTLTASNDRGYGGSHAASPSPIDPTTLRRRRCNGKSMPSRRVRPSPWRFASDSAQSSAAESARRSPMLARARRSSAIECLARQSRDMARHAAVAGRFDNRVSPMAPWARRTRIQTRPRRRLDGPTRAPPAAAMCRCWHWRHDRAALLTATSRRTAVEDDHGRPKSGQRRRPEVSAIDGRARVAGSAAASATGSSASAAIRAPPPQRTPGSASLQPRRRRRPATRRSRFRIRASSR